MNKTKIEWCDYTINPIKGLCQMGCSYCYARRMYKRFKWNKEIRYIPEELNKIKNIKEPSRIFLCSTHDLFGNWIPDKWIFDIITKCQNYPQHTFLLLTKNAKRYADWTFRKNFWLGQTITNNNSQIFLPRERGITYISFEPLLDSCDKQYIGFNEWIIIGAMTGQGSEKFAPKKEWVENIIEQARRFKISIFLKNNLKWKEKIQEFPK